ncbi:hypothetical protein FHX52_0592 [Humibacillus xanthopallidus]|uniref:Uncharacterized protein n=1 Tax=Humibacillus xanthopallidus TaxID=412689 RepID=A0A543PTV5_9MICO|nr:hypothetical protein [Humibacillus xanthopallidus]TQN47490.1 hypothetical protein FHX52_0592 [Humibacillus xanthopallidus]
MTEAAGLADDLALLRAHEPVLRLTQGEYFVPVAVDAYVAGASLVGNEAGTSEVLAVPGSLTLDELARRGAAHDGPGLSLSGLTEPDSWWGRVRRLLPGRRPSFRPGSRLAQVGLLGRTIDTVSRASLLLRGSVPGGSAATAYAVQRERLSPDRPTYYGRVVRSDDWIVCQYWFFYSFNNWRSGFSGVNEHEADWEQVTIYLDGTGAIDADGLPPARWVVFSAHDEVGDDLRRRWDDPDLSIVDGRHPVVFAGAGSHSGAYLPGDYLITIAPPSLGGVVPAVRRIAKIFAPWVRAAQSEGLGIPYVDYARGDGSAIGPQQEQAWNPVVIGEDTPWVRDYRGLWGHDTQDRLGGERGPAGPRYERDATVRASWGDPVGWAGLAKVAPGPGAEARLLAERIDDIDTQVLGLETEATQLHHTLTSRSAGLGPDSPAVRALAPDELTLSTLRMQAVHLRDERGRLERAARDGLPVASPHAHLSHRRTPITSSDRTRDRVLGFWSVVSTPIVLYLLSGLVAPDMTDRPVATVLVITFVLGVEAFARGYLGSYLLRLVALTVLLTLLVDVAENWQVVTSWVLLSAAVVVLLVNLRDVVRR